MDPTNGHLEEEVVPGCALPHLDSIAEHDASLDKRSVPNTPSSARPSTSLSTALPIPSKDDGAANKGPRLGRKVGRPILYTGDPNAPGLTSVERQTIARRNANRHSAKRVRLRRQDELEQLQDKVRYLQEANTALRVQNQRLRDDRDSRGSDSVVVPRDMLTPISATQEGVGAHNAYLKKSVNRETLSGVVPCSSVSRWDGCFDLIPAGFLGLDRPL
ncbi:g9564 [Coccomyxa viridis]|uniref:G9564 protein n=1 Tax=Coccomyxa viridis TaxID=1274662 RepID=A0ABP1G5X9_9CHLO